MKKRLLLILTLILAMSATLLAGCGKVEFKISFMVDGSEYHHVNTNGAEVIKMPNNPQKEGYEFDGWFWDKDVWQKPFTANSLLDAPLSENLQIFAKWTTESSLVGTDATFEGFEQLNDTEYMLKVKNDTTMLSLGDKIKVNARSSWKLSADIQGNNTIASKTVTLAIGDNTYYVLVEASDNTSKLYVLNIRRRPIYNVIFDTSPGSAASSQKIEEDSLATEPTPTRTGYGLNGWSYNFDEPIVQNEIITAYWKAKTYTLTFNANGGDVALSNKTVTFDQSFTLPTPTLRGNEFKGWFYNNNLIQEGIWTFDESRTIQAKWQLINYTITYELNGGRMLTFNPSSYTVESNTITLNNPTRTGYTFTGWTGTDLNTQTPTVTISASSIGNKNYVANWAKNDYEINYNLNGGSNNPNNLDGYTIESANIALQNPSRTGYIFEGWFTESNFINRKTTISSGSYGNIDLHAKWKAITYAIKFNANGGTGNMSNQSLTYDNEGTLKSNAFVRSGYTFTKWTTNSNGSGQIYNDLETVKNLTATNSQVIELYANWTANTYEISFDKQGGEGGTNNVTATFDKTMPLATAPAERTGYTFNGYYDQKIGGVQYYNSYMNSVRTWNKTSNTTLYAQWSANTYLLILDKQGGIGENDFVEAIFNEDMPTAPTPTRAGYTFEGYFTEINGGGEQYYSSNMTSLYTFIKTEGLTLYAKWTVNSYTVSFNANGGVGIPNSIIATYDAQMPEITVTPERTGYTFNGYFDSISGGKKYYDEELTTLSLWDIAANTTLYAQWTANSYKVDLDKQGGVNGTDSVFANYDSHMPSATAPTKTGYTFGGYFTAVNGEGEQYYSDTMTSIQTYTKTENITLYAKWTANNYTVVFNANGGANIPNNIVATYDAVMPTVTIVSERTGYIFKGYYDSISGGKQYYDKDLNNLSGWDKAANTTLYAQWTAIEYTVEFEASGGTGDMSSQTFIYDVPQSLNINAFSNAGYTFVAWYTNAQYTGVSYTDTASVKNLANEQGAIVKLYAKWQTITYTITYTTNGGINNANNPNNYNIESADIQLIEPIKTGYTFTGWFDNGDYQGEQIFTINQGSIGNIELFARWSINTYTITFDTNGGEPIDSLDIVYNGNITYPTPKRAEFTFDGWYLNLNDETPYQASKMPSLNITLYAKWKAYSLNDFVYNSNKLAVSVNDDISAALFEATLLDSDGDLVPISVTINGNLLGGEIISVRLLASGKYGNNKQLTITNIKVYDTPTLNYNLEKDSFNLSDLMNYNLWNASGVDSFGVATSISVFVEQESYTGGNLVTIIIESRDIVNNVNKAIIENVKVYGNPNILYNDSLVNIKETDVIGNELWSVAAVDSFGVDVDVNTVLLSGTQTAGQTITLKITATDTKGNIKTETFEAQVYGLPTINSATKTDFKVSDQITVLALGVAATDSFGEQVFNVTLLLKSGAQVPGTSMVFTVKAIDKVGNETLKDIIVKIYDTPEIYSTKNYISINDNLENALIFGVKAKDSFGGNITVSHSYKSGNKIGGQTITYTFTATDKSGNVTINDFTFNVYSSDDIQLSYSIGSVKAIKISSKGEEFLASATDSFNGACSLIILDSNGKALQAGVETNIIIRAFDKAGNYKDSNIISKIRVYDTPTAGYNYNEYYLKHNDNIEFMFTVKDSFGIELYAETTQISFINNIKTIKVTAVDSVGNTFEEYFELYQLKQNQSYLALYFNDLFIDYAIATNGQSFILPTVLFSGYDEFIGWTINDMFITDNQGNSLETWDKPSDLYVLQPNMVPTIYSLTYILDGGENNPDNPDIYTVLDLGGENGTIALGSPSKAPTHKLINRSYTGGGKYLNTFDTVNYIFLGWFQDADFTEVIDKIVLELGSDTFYAKWEPIPTITYTNTIVYERVNIWEETDINGDYIMFGEYPQNLKEEIVTITKATNEKGYYLGDDGNYYAKVIASPAYNSYTFSTGDTITSGAVYYFKVEPIKWRILAIENGEMIILCESIIANKAYYKNQNSRTIDGERVYPSNYKYSDIKEWLNDKFYKTAFNSLQQELIQITEVDNSIESTGFFGSNKFICENTFDKIFLPSIMEIMNLAYGFDDAKSRIKQPTDYTRATGASMDIRDDYYGNGILLLRSPYENGYSTTSVVGGVQIDGSITGLGCTSTALGIAPALRILL